jgi:uncharacterized protein (TIGR00369 family)
MNPDLVLVRRFIAAPGVPLAVDSNPLAVALGARLEGFDSGRRELAMAYAPQPLFRQGAGVVQGGAIASMLDFAMAFACFTQLPDGAAVSTLTLGVTLQKAATAARYEAIGRVDKPGRRVMFASAEMKAGDGLIATSTSTLLVLG